MSKVVPIRRAEPARAAPADGAGLQAGCVIEYRVHWEARRYGWNAVAAHARWLFPLAALDVEAAYTAERLNRLIDRHDALLERLKVKPA